MSYADVAAKGPKQSDAEIMHDDSGVHSLDSLSSSGPNIVPSYADQQLAHERSEEARREGERAADRMATQARDFERLAEEELQRLEQESGRTYNDFSHEAKQSYESWKSTIKREYESMSKEVRKDGSIAKKKAKEADRWAADNKDNPVVIGNVVVLGALATLLGVGAYRMHQKGELTGKVVGIWAGAIGLFAVGDYFVSQFFFKKYPPK